MKYPEGMLIRGMRTYADLTLKELGKRAGLSITALSNLENGEADVIGKKSRERLLGVLLQAIDQRRATDKARAEETQAKIKQLRRDVEKEYKSDEPMKAASSALFQGFAIAQAISDERNRQVEKLIQSYEEGMAKEESQLEESKSRR
jgi:transcriptional regulator with XRE-family HTH domain